MSKDTRTLFADALRATGLDLRQSAEDVASLALQRTAHLATLADQPGFLEAVGDEAARVWLYAADRSVRVGDATDARALGLIHGVLFGLAAR